MKISVNKVIRYIIAAILFAILFVNLYFATPGNNNFTEPADLVLSIITPIILLVVLTLLLYFGQQHLNNRILYVFLFGLIIFGGAYLSRNYWYKLDTFWSFVLSVVLPLSLMVALIRSPLLSKLYASKSDSKK